MHLHLLAQLGNNQSKQETGLRLQVTQDQAIMMLMAKHSAKFKERSIQKQDVNLAKISQDQAHMMVTLRL